MTYFNTASADQADFASPPMNSRRFFAGRLRQFLITGAMLTLAGCAIPSPFGSQPSAGPVPTVELTYADSAELALASPIIADISVIRAIPLPAERSAGLQPGHVRYYVEARINTLLRGEGGLPGQIDLLADWPAGAGNLEGRRFLAFARPVPGRPATIQLVRSDSLIAWTPSNDTMTRTATQEAVAINAPPVIASVGRAFHFPGQVEGEGETQIFFETESADPVSLRIVSTPGQRRRWGFSLGEVVAADLTPPPRNSLLWYRLACDGLPARLPSSSIAAGANAAKIQSDYQFVLDDLGPCTRNLR